MAPKAACRPAPLALSGLAAVWLAAAGWLYYHGCEWGTLWKIRGYWPSLFPDLAGAEGRTVLRDLKLLAELLWLVLLGRGAGAAFLDYAGLNTGERPGQFALNLAAGWGAMSLAMFGLGLAGAWNKPLLFTLLCAGAAALAVREYRAWRARSVAPSSPKIQFLSWNSIWFLLLAAFAALNLLAAFVPGIFYDALVYHLALPDLYWKHGGVIATPWNLYSGLPQLVETLYAMALPVGGDGLARLMHWAFGLGTALLTYVIAARLAGKRTAALAVLLFYTMPVVGVLSGQSMTDLGWAFFQLSALYALCLRLDAPDASRKWTALSGVLAGFAMGSRVLFVGEARGFYCRRDYIAGTLFDEPPLREWLRGSRDAAGLLSRFQREGITHVLVNQGELESWRKDAPGYLALNAREAEILADFNKRFLKLLFEDRTPPGGWVQVLEVSRS